MIFKHGVRLTADIHPVTSFVIFVVDAVYKDVVGHEAMCTSADDRTHGPGSLHPHGAAWDFRTYVENLPYRGRYKDNVLNTLVDRLQLYLGPMFDVVLESDHIHIEFDPKLALVT